MYRSWRSINGRFLLYPRLISLSVVAVGGGWRSARDLEIVYRICYNLFDLVLPRSSSGLFQSNSPLHAFYSEWIALRTATVAWWLAAAIKLKYCQPDRLSFSGSSRSDADHDDGGKNRYKFWRSFPFWTQTNFAKIYCHRTKIQHSRWGHRNSPFPAPLSSYLVVYTSNQPIKMPLWLMMTIISVSFE